MSLAKFCKIYWFWKKFHSIYHTCITGNNNVNKKLDVQWINPTIADAFAWAFIVNNSEAKNQGIGPTPIEKVTTYKSRKRIHAYEAAELLVFTCNEKLIVRFFGVHFLNPIAYLPLTKMNQKIWKYRRPWLQNSRLTNFSDLIYPQVPLKRKSWLRLQHRGLLFRTWNSPPNLLFRMLM